MDLKGFHLDSYYLINLYEVNYKHEDHEYIKQKIIKKFYPYHQIKTKDDFVIYNCVNQIIFNVIEKHKLFDIFGNILPYDVIELFVTNNSINLDDFKISKTFDIHKFANTYDNEEINKEWFTNYSEMFKNYIYFE
jgi:hypothetical protein